MKKFLTYSVVIATIVWSLGLGALVPMAAQAAYSPASGDIIKVAGNPAVYYIGSDLKRQLFSNRVTYGAWFNDFAGLKTITQTEFNTIDSGANVTVRPGTSLVKFDNAGAVYAVTPGAKLLPLVSGDAAKALYGADWAKKIVVIQSSFEANYTKDTANALTTTSKLPDGSVIKYAGSDSVYYITAGTKRLVTTDGFVANKLSDKFVVTNVPATVTYTDGASVTAKEDAIAGISGAVAVVTTTGNLTVSLSSDTPTSQDIPENSSVTFLKLKMAAGSDSDVSVTGIKLSALGLGDSSEIDGVSIFVNGIRYGNARDIDSNKVAQINFTSPIVIAKGTTVTVDVKASVTGTGRYSLGVVAASDIAASSSVGGSYPIVSNIMGGTNVTLGQLSLDDNGSLASVKLGDKAATVAKVHLSNNNVEDITLNAISLKRDSASTASDGALENLGLYLDGTKIASAPALVGHYANFTLDTPVTVLKNGVKDLVVKADIVDGAGKNIKLYIDSKADVTAVGAHYGFPSIISITAFTTQTVTINAGAVSIEKVNAPVTKLKKDTANTLFGTFKVTVNSGKNAELSTLKLTIASTNDAGAGVAFSQIENVKVLVKNNNTTYDMDYVTAAGTSPKVYSNASMGLVLTSGVTYEMQVQADVKSSATNGDYIVKINDAAGGDFVLKETGNDTTITDITPNSVSLASVSVEGASLTFSKNALSASYSAVVGTPDIEVLNFNATAGASSDVKISSLTFVDGVSHATKSVVSEFKLWKYNGSTYDLIKTVSANDLAAYTIVLSDLNEVVAANTTAKYKLTASAVNDSNNDTVTLRFGLTAGTVTETTRGTTISVAGSVPQTSARTVTLVGSGTLQVSVDNVDNTATAYDTYQLAGTSGVSLATFKFRANNEPITVTKLHVIASSDISSLITKYSLVRNSDNVEVASTTNIGTTDTSLTTNFVVPVVDTLYTLKADLGNIGQGAPGAKNVASTFKLNGIEANGVGGSLAIDTDGTLSAGGIGYETACTDNKTAASKTAGFVASKIAAVSLETSALGTSVGGSMVSTIGYNAAIIKVTVPATTNDDSGSPVVLNLSRIKIKINGGTGITSYAATIQRLGGSGTATSDSNHAGGYADWAGLSGADYAINAGDSAYFLVKITPVFTATFSKEFGLSVSLDNLNDSAGTHEHATTGSNFSWTDITSGATKYEVRLGNGVSSVDGGSAYLIQN